MDWASARSRSRPSRSGFPTDLQAVDGADDARQGHSHITETIFENRRHVELAHGARIHLAGERATIEGVESPRARRSWRPICAPGLARHAALAAEGDTMVNRVYHLDRGFERLEDKLSACGAVIERISG